MVFTPSTHPLEQHKEVVQTFLDETHANRLEVIDTLVAPDIVTHNFPGGPSPRSREEYKDFFRSWNRGVPRQGFAVLAMVAEGDKVAVQYAITGRHEGELLGLPPTGRQLAFTGVALYRMANGQIAETWLYPDSATLLQQLGVLPTVPAAPEVRSP